METPAKKIPLHRRLEVEAKSITVVKFFGKRMAVKPQRRDISTIVRNANFLGTKKAACGFLLPGEDLDGFKARWIRSQKKFR